MPWRKDSDAVQSLIGSRRGDRIQRFKDKWDEKGSIDNYSAEEIIVNLKRNVDNFEAMLLSGEFNDALIQFDDVCNLAGAAVVVTERTMK